MGFGSLLRSVVPPRTRAALRGSKLVRRALAYWYGGPRSLPHPHSRYQLHFDGYRNIGWTLGGLAATESDEFAVVRQLLQRKRCECVWDIGANVGLWTLFLAGIEPPIPRIVCFEPDQANQGYLRMNKEKNRLEQVTIRDVALSAEPGQMTFYADAVTGSTGGLEAQSQFIEKFYNTRRQEIQVTVSTVDNEVRSGMPAPQFMKIDVEGHELSLLQGAIETLERHHPAIMVEVIRNQEQIAELLTSRGYHLISAHTRKPIELPEMSTLCLYGEDQAAFLS